MAQIQLECQEFTRFDDLPLEIRLNIWRLASNQPRFIHIESDRKAKVPAVLHTNYESRNEAKKLYSLVHIHKIPSGQPYTRARISKHEEYINLGQDTICFFPQKTEHDGFYTRVQQQDIGIILRHCENLGVQHFATDMWLWCNVIRDLACERTTLFTNYGLGMLPYLPELTASTSIRTVSLCPPFMSSTVNEHRKRLASLNPDCGMSKEELEEVLVKALRFYERLNPNAPWKWKGTVQFASVESDDSGEDITIENQIRE